MAEIEPVLTRLDRSEPAVGRSFFERSPQLVAPELLGARVRIDGSEVTIVEVESYGGSDDPASHAYRGPTPRCMTMFGEPGCLYVYRTYGVHYCANIVAHRPGEAGAVLLRGAEVRGEARDESVPVRGPGRLTALLSLSTADDGADLLVAPTPGRRTLSLVSIDTDRAFAVSVGPRVGIVQAAAWPSRHWITGNPGVSAFRPGRQRPSSPREH